MGANDRQVGGLHYKISGEQHWDRVDKLDLDYFQGQITKYIERWKLKNGIQDLEKAAHFLAKYIELAKDPDSNVYASHQRILATRGDGSQAEKRKGISRR